MNKKSFLNTISPNDFFIATVISFYGILCVSLGTTLLTDKIYRGNILYMVEREEIRLFISIAFIIIGIAYIFEGLTKKNRLILLSLIITSIISFLFWIFFTFCYSSIDGIIAPKVLASKIFHMSIFSSISFFNLIFTAYGGFKLWQKS